MLYPALTVIVGSIVATLSIVSLVGSARAGGIFINQARFLLSGLLLILHFPLTSLLDSLILPWYEKIGAVEGNASASYWTAMVLLVTIQLIVLPTRHEMYASYVADRITRRTGA